MAYFQDVSSRVAFREAVQACEMDGGSLLSIQSPTEQRDIENLLQELRSGAVGGASGGRGGISDGDFWIGLTRVDQTEPGNSFTSCPQLYQWTDGSVATFRNWYLDEPSCGGEACVVMYHQPTALPGLGGAYLYQWNDDRCNMKHNFICKYKPESHLVKEHSDSPEGRDTGKDRHTPFTHLPHAFHMPATRLSLACHTPFTCLPHAFHSPATLLSHACHMPATRLSHACHTPVTRLSHACHTPVTRLPHAFHTPFTRFSTVEHNSRTQK
uniref:Chondrolectin n=1 Tax=Amphiprion percula TaxID=161767 RepID=A0A3P8UDI3_AMPPE